MLLLDSGGQYKCGTTDVTRTVHTGPGPPTPWQREMFTRVLKGHIAFDSLVFPRSTPTAVLDAVARAPLWQARKDYSHSTGHGVGAALCVHEHPPFVGRSLSSTLTLCEGQVLSNEPGYYETGSFGVRIENLLLVVPAGDEPTGPSGGAGEEAGSEFLRFHTLTMVPIQKKLVDVDMLSPAEVQWLDDYHRSVRLSIMPVMRTERGRAWLRDATEPING